jgi:hypothetical protein
MRCSQAGGPRPGIYGAPRPAWARRGGRVELEHRQAGGLACGLRGLRRDRGRGGSSRRQFRRGAPERKGVRAARARGKVDQDQQRSWRRRRRAS